MGSTTKSFVKNNNAFLIFHDTDFIFLWYGDFGSVKNIDAFLLTTVDRGGFRLFSRLQDEKRDLAQTKTKARGYRSF